MKGPNVFPVLQLQVARTAGYHKFCDASKDEVNKVIKEERDATKVSHLQIPAMYQKMMSAKWKELLEAEQDEWESKVVEDPDHDLLVIYK